MFVLKKGGIPNESDFVKTNLSLYDVLTLVQISKKVLHVKMKTVLFSSRAEEISKIFPNYFTKEELIGSKMFDVNGKRLLTKRGKIQQRLYDIAKTIKNKEPPNKKKKNFRLKCFDHHASMHRSIIHSQKKKSLGMIRL